MQIQSNFRCDEVSSNGYRKLAPRVVDRVCIVCASTFSFVKVGAGRIRAICSTSCTQKRLTVGRKEEGRKRWLNQEPSEFSCKRCGKAFLSKQTKASYCSKACTAAGIAKKLEALSIATTHRPCEKCGTLFRPYRPSRDQKRRGQYQRFCSEACGLLLRRTPIQKDATRSRLRLRRVGGFDPIAVLERDGWRCHLCGVKTPKHLRGTTDLRAPEVDHIDPIASGGKHDMLNTACACRRCNLKKGATPKGQLRLFG